MEVVKHLITKEREYVKQFIPNVDSMSDYEVDKLFEELITEQNKPKERKGKKNKKKLWE